MMDERYILFGGLFQLCYYIDQDGEEVEYFRRLWWLSKKGPAMCSKVARKRIYVYTSGRRFRGRGVHRNLCLKSGRGS